MSSEFQSISPPAHSMVYSELVELPPGQMDSWTRAGVWGKSNWLVVAFQVSDFLRVRPTLPSTSQTTWSGVHWIS